MAWDPSVKEKILLREYKETYCLYDKFRAVDTALRHQVLRVFEDTYFYPLKKDFKGCSVIPTTNLIGGIYGHYTRITVADLSENDTHLRKVFNPDDPLKSLYTRLNKCGDYGTAASNPITEGHISRIAYSLVMKTGQFKEDCRI